MRYSYFSLQPLEISPKTLIYKFRSVRCDRVSGFVSICLNHVSEDIDVDLVDWIKPNFLYPISCPIGYTYIFTLIYVPSGIFSLGPYNMTYLPYRICLSEIQWIICHICNKWQICHKMMVTYDRYVKMSLWTFIIQHLALKLLKCLFWCLIAFDA